MSANIHRLIVNAVRPSDIDVKSALVAISEIHIRSLRTTLSGIIGKSVLYYYYLDVLSCDRNIILVAECEQKICGYVVGLHSGYKCRAWQYHAYRLLYCLVYFWRITRMMFSGSGAPRYHGNDNVIELRPISVHRDMQGKGIGSLLLDAFNKESRKEGYDGIWLATEIDNLIACRLYTTKGYETIAETQGYRIFTNSTELLTDEQRTARNEQF